MNYPAAISNIITSLVFLLYVTPQVLSGQESGHLLQASKVDTVEQAVTMTGYLSKQNESLRSLEDYMLLNHALPPEKIYLHLDRTSYLSGDTIWFKAYSWFGYDQVPDTASGILYVDLLNPEGKVKLKRKLLIQNGTSRGDFSIDSTIIPGQYTLRAYTRWIKNSNAGEPFYQPVKISPVSQNFQIECLPVILKHAGNDSLKVSFSFFEIDRTGDLMNTLSHKMEYCLRSGNQILLNDQVEAINTKEKFFKYDLASIDDRDITVQLEFSVKDDRINYTKQFSIRLMDNIDLQFFPEGGKLVAGIESRVAFKTTGTDGLSREVHGVIETADGDFVTDFESSHKGMGAFMIKPKAGKEYNAILWYENRKFVIPLPSSSEEGSVMLVNYSDDENVPYLKIMRTASEFKTPKYLIGSSNGKIRFSALVKLTNDSAGFQILADLLPEGICRLTLMNEYFEPECERLIYVSKDHLFKIEVIPDSSSYSTRSKVSLLIKTTGVDGSPAKADLSLAVVDKEQFNRNNELGGICFYKLVGSELQGYIEDAGYYFNSGTCTNRSALDLLLLTQGYRKFLRGTKKPEKQIPEPEKSIDISGKIKFIGSVSQKKKINFREVILTLICRSEEIFIYQSSPDSLGQFRFQIPLLIGKSHMLLQAKNLKGKSFPGEINIDDAEVLPEIKPPLVYGDAVAIPEIENVRRLQAVKKTETSKIPWYGAMSVTLGEVVVMAKAKNWYRDYEKEAIKIADLDSMDPAGKRYNNINELLIREFGAREYTIRWGDNLKTVLLPCISFGSGSNQYFPIYVINGNTAFNAGERRDNFLSNLKDISYLPVNEIKKLMVLPPGRIASHYADMIVGSEIKQSLVVIEIYNDSYRGDPTGIKNYILDGLDAPREFYSPRYDGPSRNYPVYDGRATLYWNPSIKTDYTGKAKVDFYTSDSKTELLVIVNGIEVTSGYPGQGQAEFNSALKKLTK